MCRAGACPEAIAKDRKRYNTLDYFFYDDTKAMSPPKKEVSVRLRTIQLTLMEEHTP